VLVVLTVLAYSHVFKSGFVVFDDDDYVTANQHIQHLTWKNLGWAFNIGYAANWHPLTWMSHMMDYRLFGPNPAGHHAINLILHILNSLLVLMVLRRMTGSLWRSAFVAGLFAVHPLHVESVAWIAERKDVLSTLFWLLTMGAYVLYAEKPALKRYLPVVFLYALGLMAKPMLVTLPLVLLLLDYWPLSRVRKEWSIVWEKLPLLLLAAGASVLTILAQNKGAIQSLDTLSLADRIANVPISYVRYIEKMFWPSGLAVFYPHPHEPLLSWKVVGSALLLFGLTTAIFMAARKRPYLGIGWLWYLITLVPVIGVLQVGVQAMADRYTYIPLIGLFIAVVWLIPDSLIEAKRVGDGEKGRGGEKPRIAVAAVACTIIAVLAIATFTQVEYWQDRETLFRHATEVTEGNYMAHMNLGLALSEQGRSEEAIENYRKAIAIQPKWNAGGHYDIAMNLWDLGDLNGAMVELRETLRFDPKFAQAHCNLGLALKEQNKIDEAIKEYREAIRLKPDMSEAHNNLAVALYGKGEYAQAWKEVYLCRKYGGSPIPDFLNALSEKTPDPRH
jgi:Tfp pilus assembly protein PilF